MCAKLDVNTDIASSVGFLQQHDLLIIRAVRYRGVHELSTLTVVFVEGEIDLERFASGPEFHKGPPSAPRRVSVVHR